MLELNDKDRDTLLTWLVVDVLAVRPARLTRQIRSFHGERPLATQIFERWRFRAALSGVPTGIRDDLAAAIVASGFEHVEWLRRGAIARSLLGYSDDPGFFERPDWARVALGIGERETVIAYLARSLARFTLRTSAIRAARWTPYVLGPVIGRVAAPLVGAGVGAALSVLSWQRCCGVARVDPALDEHPAPPADVVRQPV